MPPVSFFKSPWDLLAKVARDRGRLIRELDRYDGTDAGRIRIVDAAFDSAITAHSIGDWALKASGKPEGFLNVWRGEHVALTLLQDCANGNKHLGFDGRYQRARDKRQPEQRLGAAAVTAVGNPESVNLDVLYYSSPDSPAELTPIRAGDTKPHVWVKLTAESKDRYDLLDILARAIFLWGKKLADLEIPRPEGATPR